MGSEGGRLRGWQTALREAAADVISVIRTKVPVAQVPSHTFVGRATRDPESRKNEAGS